MTAPLEALLLSSSAQTSGEGAEVLEKALFETRNLFLLLTSALSELLHWYKKVEVNR